MSKQPWVVIRSTLLSHCLQKHRANQNVVGRETQAGLNTNINHFEGVGPGTILLFTFHSAFKKHNHLQAPKDTSSPPLWNGNRGDVWLLGGGAVSVPFSSLPPSQQIPLCPLGCHRLWPSSGPTCPTLGCAPRISWKLAVLRRDICKGRCPRWPYTI